MHVSPTDCALLTERPCGVTGLRNGASNSCNSGIIIFMIMMQCDIT